MAYTYYKIADFSGGWHSGAIGIEVVSQSISGNYSVINLVLRAREDVNASSYNNGGANEFIKVDGVTKVSDDTIDFRDFVTGTWYTILSKTNITVYHDADGEKTISVQGYCATGVGAGTYNQTQSIALPTIPRKSSISSLTSAVSVNGTNAVTVGISRASSGFTHTVKFSIGAYSQTFTGVATSQSFAIPLAWLNAIPNAISGVATCRVTTYDGATNLGYVEKTFTLNVPGTVIPVVTDIAFSKVADVFSSGIFARGITKLNITGATVTNQYSATTKTNKTYIHVPAHPYTTGTLYAGIPVETNLLSWAGTARITEIVTDSRGLSSAEYHEDITVYDYFAPTLVLTAFRCDAAGVADPSGEYLSATMVVNVAPVNNDNTHVYTLEYRKVGDAEWSPISTAALTGYSGTLNAVRSASSAYTWEVRATVADKVNTVQKATAVGTKRIPINVGNAGLAVAIGKMAETDGFETAYKVFGNGLNLSDIPTSFKSEVAASTADKGTFTGHVFLNSIIELIMTLGNTAASPTITIGGVTYSITGMPTVARISGWQTYRLQKTGATTLAFTQDPGYICEHGTSGDWTYIRFANGKTQAWGKITGINITSSGAFGTGGLYIMNGTFTIPTGIFNATPCCWASHPANSTVYAGVGAYATSATAGGVNILKTSSTGATVTECIHALGTWK